jgi:hypothetical protein
MGFLDFGAGEAITAASNIAMLLMKQAQENKWRGAASATWDDYLAKAKSMISMDPEGAKNFLQLTDKTAYDSMDPRAEQASQTAIDRLIETGSGSGLDTQSRVAMQQGMGQSGAAARAAREAVMSSYRRGGTGGSSQEMGAALMGNQQGYSDLAAAGGQAAAGAQQRRLEANTLASRAAQQQQQLQQQKAQARDALNRFNVTARQNVLGQQQSAMTTYGQGASGKANAYGGFANNVNQFGSSGAGVAGGIGAAAGVATDWLGKLSETPREEGDFGPL